MVENKGQIAQNGQKNFEIHDFSGGFAVYRKFLASKKVRQIAQNGQKPFSVKKMGKLPEKVKKHFSRDKSGERISLSTADSADFELSICDL